MHSNMPEKSNLYVKHVPSRWMWNKWGKYFTVSHIIKKDHDFTESGCNKEMFSALTKLVYNNYSCAKKFSDYLDKLRLLQTMQLHLYCSSGVFKIKIITALKSSKLKIKAFNFWSQTVQKTFCAKTINMHIGGLSCFHNTFNNVNILFQCCVVVTLVSLSLFHLH